MAEQSATSSGSSGSPSLVYVKRRHGTVLLHAGHEYHTKRKDDSGLTVWKCTKRPKCKGLMTIKLNFDYSTISRMFNFRKKFRDPDESIINLNIMLLETWGMFKRNHATEKIMYYFFIFGAVYFVPSQYIELWLLRNDQDLALRNLSYTLLSTTCFVKATTLIIWKDDWKKIIDCVTNLEQRQHFTIDEKCIMEQHKRYSRIVTSLYCFLAGCTVIIVTVAPLIVGLCFSENRERILNKIDPFPEIMSSWVPFDKSRGLGYYVTALIQAAVYIWGGGLVGGFDSLAVALMIFFSGQLQVLKIRCENIFTEESDLLTYTDINKMMKECSQYHEIIMTHGNILRSLLSPVLFLYIIVCSIMICAAATQLTTEGITMVQQVWLAEYLIALVSQLFLYCWHSNVVFTSSLSVNYGVFASAWWRYDFRVQRSVLLLNGKLRKTLLLTAGPFTTLQLSTFLAVLKGSYSYYTLLK